MEQLILSGRPVAEACKETIKTKIDAAKAAGKSVALAILTVGKDPASFVYRGRLLKMAESLGAESRCVELAETSTTAEVVAEIQKLNHDETITGILPMMPMPPHVDQKAVGSALAPEKDMDCLNPANGGALLVGQGRKAACTPRACSTGTQQCGRKTCRPASAAGKLYGDHLSFPHKKPAGAFTAGGYYCGRCRKSRLCDRGNG